MNISTNKIIGAALVGFVVWQVAKPKTGTPANQPPPPRPHPSSDRDKWVKWASVIIAIFGQAKKLWEPGGPFYNTPVPEPNAEGGGPFWDDVANVAGIGKVHDEVEIRPRSRVDEFWKDKLKVEAGRVGLSEITH